MEVFMLVLMAMVCYLVGRVAYVEGRRSKWEEISKCYIVLHKSVLIEPNKPQKTLDKHKKKKYNKFTTSNK